MKPTTTCCIVLLALGMVPVNASDDAWLNDAARKGAWFGDAASQMVFFAVWEGLYEDGVPNEVVDLIIPRDPKSGEPRMTEHFVYACPLCHPAFEAFRLYRSRQPFFGQKMTKFDSFGTGLEPSLVEQLQSEQKLERLAAVQSLVERWVGHRLDSMRLTPRERQEWEQRLDALRQRGKEQLERYQATKFPSGPPESAQAALRNDSFRQLYADWKGCAVCDGSANACKLAK
jgi:hypothetical protein